MVVKKILNKTDHIEINKNIKTIISILLVVFFISVRHLFDGSKVSLIILFIEILLVIGLCIKKYNYAVEIENLSLEALYDYTILNFYIISTLIYFIGLNRYISFKGDIYINIALYTILQIITPKIYLERNKLDKENSFRAVLIIFNLILLGLVLFNINSEDYKTSVVYSLCIILSFMLQNISSKLMYDKKYIIK